MCVASIISKKAAENVSALVLDVKVGRASFSPTLADARHLAKNLVRILNYNTVCFFVF
jgi:thymidine phosphorylase